MAELLRVLQKPLATDAGKPSLFSPMFNRNKFKVSSGG
jgi:hypothetical protein